MDFPATHFLTKACPYCFINKCKKSNCFGCTQEQRKKLEKVFKRRECIFCAVGGCKNHEKVVIKEKSEESKESKESEKKNKGEWKVVQKKRKGIKDEKSENNENNEKENKGNKEEKEPEMLLIEKNNDEVEKNKDKKKSFNTIVKSLKQKPLRNHSNLAYSSLKNKTKIYEKIPNLWKISFCKDKKEEKEEKEIKEIINDKVKEVVIDEVKEIKEIINDKVKKVTDEVKEKITKEETTTIKKPLSFSDILKKKSMKEKKDTKNTKGKEKPKRSTNNKSPPPKPKTPDKEESFFDENDGSATLVFNNGRIEVFNEDDY